MRIGVAGRNAAGKTLVVDYLERRSFFRASLSDVIRADLARDGLEATRENMIARGNDLRERFGPAVLAERVGQLLPSGRNHVLDSIRHPAEVEALRAAGDFALLWIDAPIEQRYARSRNRARAGDGDTLDAFRALEARELENDDPAAQQLLAVAGLADHVVHNDAGVPELEAKLAEILGSLLLFSERPSWDDYFNDIARVVASRSNCVKRKVGAVIVVDRRIISTGYNGTPRGTRNCNEGGCPRCAGAAEAGTRLDECLCSHAEENAITQAAYHGVSVRGASIYTTLCPCLLCTKMIINAGLAEVIYDVPFEMDSLSAGLFREAGIKLRQVGT